MIVGQRKPVDEIIKMIDGCNKVLVMGCGTCVTICHAGGEKETGLLASALRIACKEKEIIESTIERQCDMEFMDDAREKVVECDAVVSMACGAGVQFVSDVFEGKAVFPALNTTFYAVTEEQGVWTEYCQGCGNCVLHLTGGICPVARCSKSLMNGPCGGSADGKCEVDPKNIDCGWHQIVERLTKLGKLDSMDELMPYKDWSSARDGGPRKMIREDLLL